ncbi:hypothetical protein CGI34_06865 [Vibrio parahaemolyticus]|nr:hypothetical protein CGI34_06865 [Vibrio parahaemolyticus]
MAYHLGTTYVVDYKAIWALWKRFVCENKRHNKAFKSDSQRLAFFIPSLSSVFTVVWLSFVVALFTP